MNEQMTIFEAVGEKIILPSEYEDAEKKLKELREAKAKALFLIDDAKARYVKQKTAAKSKKAAMEREALANSPKFAKLKEYNRYEDIQEAYGWDCINEKERDQLQELWQERESIRNHVENGVYRDKVTNALMEAWRAVDDLWEDEIQVAEKLKKDFFIQKQKADEEYQEIRRQRDEEYRRLTGGK